MATEKSRMTEKKVKYAGLNESAVLRDWRRRKLKLF